MNPIPISVVVRLRNASDKFVVAAFLITWVSSEIRFRSSPVLVTSKNAISCSTRQLNKSFFSLATTRSLAAVNKYARIMVAIDLSTSKSFQVSF
jgi:hypothetical protein